MSKTLGRSSSSSSSFSGSTTNAVTAAGTSLHLPNWTSSSSTPADSSGVDGDFHLNTSENKIYKRVSGSWVEIASLTGATGVAGAAGAAGAAGVDGQDGDDGDDGADAWYSGSGDPGSVLANTVPNGTFYYQTGTDKIFKKTGLTTGMSSGFTEIADITGPQGPQGPSGTADTWSAGTDEPSGGQDNEFYFESDAAKVWRNDSGTWGVIANLTGPQGATGPQGQQGATGPQGQQGETGDTGATGQQGPQGQQGNNGAQGEDGDDAATPNWTLATSTVAAGGTPTVQSTGTYPNQTITFGLVTGAAGTAGQDGNDGNDGQDGDDANTWLQGSSDPVGGTGDVGDFYLNATSRNWFEKTAASTWTQRGSFLEQPDWDATSGAAQILNKPTTITSSQASAIVANTAKVSNVKANWSETDSSAESFIQNKPNVQYTSAIPDATSSQTGLATSTQITKLDGLEAGAEVNVQPDWDATSGDGQILNKPNVQYTSAIPEATSSQTGLATSTQITKLDGIATSATANDTDTNLKDRANHTGQEQTADIADNAVTYAKIQDVSATDTILGRNTTGAGSVEELDASAVRGIINVANGATANSTDTYLRDRANHTGDLSLADNQKIYLGTGNDLAIYHDGNESLAVEGGTGGIKLTASAFDVRNAANDESMISAVEDASVTLYCNGSEKISTAVGGVSVTGDITVTGTVDGRDVASDGTKLDGIESAADVTDSANVDAAGAVMNSDATTASMSFVVDEDDLTSNSDTKVPTQQSVKAYVDSEVSGIVSSAPDALNTLNELAAALGDDANYATTITNALALKAPKANPTFTGTVAIPNISDLESAVTANTAKVGITTSQANAITANTAKVGITTSQADAITANTAKVSNATHTGDVTGATSLTIANGAVTNAKTNFEPGTTFKGANGNDGKITLNCSANTHGVSIQSPAHSAAASYTLTLPVDDGNANEFLQTDGSGVLEWASVDALPTQSGSTTNKFLKSTGTAGSESWETVDAFPSQSGNSGKFLTTDGSAVSWDELPQSGHNIIDESGSALTSRDNMTFKGELVAATDDGSSSTDITIDAKTAWLYG